MTDRAIVPCNGCKLCCKNDAILLQPEHGDQPATYDTMPFKHPLTGEDAFVLKRKPNGECVYLDETGCTIWNRAPALCQSFDCRLNYLKYTRHMRKQLTKKGLLSKAVLDAGRERLATLPKL